MGIYAGNTNSWWNLTGGTDSSRTYIATNKVVQSGLVLNLDAGASTSYVGSGTTWTDLSDKISSATGALPIYNTTDNYGAVKGSGTRTDANASSLVLAVPMDGANNGTTFTDESANIKGSGSAISITRNGDTKTVNAQSKFYGSSGFFDGTGDFLETASSENLRLGTSDFTIECWVYFNTLDVNTTVLRMAAGNGFDGILFCHSSSAVYITSNGGGWDIINGSVFTGLTTGAWTHLSLTRSGSTFRGFVNGTVVFTVTSSASISQSSPIARIGCANSDGGAPMNGYIQDLRIYKGVAKYTANFTPPGNPNNGTLTNGPTYSSANGGSIVFDGTNDYVTLLDSDNWHFSSGNFTAECWVYPTGSPNQPILVGQWDGVGGGTGLSWVIELSNDANRYLRALISSTGSGVDFDLISSTSLGLNQWNHCAFVRNGSTFTLYLNGVSVASTTNSNALFNATNSLTIGASSSNNSPFNGRISNVKIYKNKALSATEISQNYNALRARFGI